MNFQKLLKICLMTGCYIAAVLISWIVVLFLANIAWRLLWWLV